MILFRNKRVSLLKHFYLYETKTIKINLMNRVFLLIIMFVSSCYANAQVVRTVELTKDDDLAALLGNEKYQIDAIVVNGFLSHANISVLNDCKLNGKLRELDMSGCDVEDGLIPDNSFRGYVSSSAWFTSLKFPRNLNTIGNGAFAYVHVTELEFPSTLRVIGPLAFFSAGVLKKVTIPEGTVEIGERAFYCCNFLNEIKLPSSLKKIGEEAFWGSGNYVRELKFNEGLESIGENAFCFFNISELELPSTLVEIGNGAFSHCEKLSRLKLPANLERINNETFYKCNNLNEIKWFEKLKVIGNKAFGKIWMKSLELPDGLTTIGENVFESTVTEKLILPATLNTLSYNAFSLCTAIKEVYAKSAVPPILDINGSVVPFPKDAVLYVPVGSRDAYLNTFCRGEFKEIIETENFPTSIGGVMTGDVTYGVSGKNGAISIANNGNVSVPYYIYTADGKLYNNGVAERGTVTVNAGKGLYVVRIGNSTDKVIVK